MKPLSLFFGNNDTVQLDRKSMEKLVADVYRAGVVDGRNEVLADMYKRHHADIQNREKILLDGLLKAAELNVPTSDDFSTSRYEGLNTVEVLQEAMVSHYGEESELGLIADALCKYMTDVCIDNASQAQED